MRRFLKDSEVDTTDPPGIPPVKPDSLYNYETGTKRVFWDGRGSVDVSVYYMDWKNVQQSVAVPFENVETTEVLNGNSASGPGLDAAITLKPIDGLSLTLQGSWNKLEYDTEVLSGGALLFPKGGRLVSSPEVTAGASAEYRFPIGNGFKGRVGASVNYVSALIAQYVPTFLAGRPAAIGKLALGVDSAHWSATLYANNINNDRVIIGPDSLANGAFSTLSTPRTIGLEVGYRLK
jgi:iron complex outermembrane recepter protein